MKRRSAVFLAVLLLAGAGCRDRAQDREPTERRDGQPARGQRMLAEARACEGQDPPPLDHCAAACDLHHSNSCARAGDATRDPAAAPALYQKACDGGSGLGCAAAGRFDQARFYLRVHCEQKHAPSCLALARLFEEGRGGPADASAAATFRRQACLYGDRAACQ
jgi:TPR repeat protein